MADRSPLAPLPGVQAELLSTKRRPTVLGWGLLCMVLVLYFVELGGNNPLRPVVVATGAGVLIVGTAAALLGFRSIDVVLHSMSSHMTVRHGGVMQLSLRRNSWSEYQLMFPTEVLTSQEGADPRSRYPRRISTVPEDIFAPLLRRGRYSSLPITCERTDPFGLWRVTQAGSLSVGEDFFVTPDRLAAVDTGRENQTVGEAADEVRASTVGDSTREVVPYVAGDRPNQIHWASTARTGELMSRRYDAPQREELMVIVELIDEQSATDASVARGINDELCGRALGTVDEALGRGTEVTLGVSIADEPVSSEIHSLVQAAELLAEAGAGPVPAVATATVSCVRIDRSLKVGAEA